MVARCDSVARLVSAALTTERDDGHDRRRIPPKQVWLKGLTAKPRLLHRETLWDEAERPEWCRREAAPRLMYWTASPPFRVRPQREVYL